MDIWPFWPFFIAKNVDKTRILDTAPHATVFLVIFIRWGSINEKWGAVDETGDNRPLLGITFMLLGEYNHNLDTKGRMAIPAKFREKLLAGAIITRGIDNCLFVFANAEWEKLAQKLIALPLAQADARAFVRLMLSGATDVEIDSQGRILIPDSLRKYAGLKKEVVVAGLYNRIEVWDEATWTAYKMKTETTSEEIAEKLGELGI